MPVPAGGGGLPVGCALRRGRLSALPRRGPLTPHLALSEAGRGGSLVSGLGGFAVRSVRLRSGAEASPGSPSPAGAALGVFHMR